MKNKERIGIGSLSLLAVVIAFFMASCAGKNFQLAGIYRDKGIAYLQQGQYTSALKELLEARKISAYDPEIRYYLGVAYHGKKMNQEAVASFKDAISLKPDYSDAHNYLGTLYAEAESWDQAIEQYQKAAANILYETPASAYNNMGYAYLKKGNYQAALTSFDEAYIKDPSTNLSPLIEKNRSIALFEMGRIKQAIHHLEKSIQSAPEFPESHYWLARCYLELKDTEAASREFLFILKVAPDSEFGVKAKEGLGAIDASR
jgi:tetratricopeptide (TPR) repeat protein